MPSDGSAGTPEARVRLRVDVLDRWEFCGCGQPEAGAAALLRLLRLHPLYEHGDELRTWIPDDGVRFLLLCAVDRLGLTEHGGSIEGGWLTDEGRATLDALAVEEADQFDALMAGHCVHGHDFDDHDHDCMAADA